MFVGLPPIMHHALHVLDAPVSNGGYMRWIRTIKKAKKL